MSAHRITQRQNIFFEFSYFLSLFVDLIVDYTSFFFKLVNENQQGYVWVFFFFFLEGCVRKLAYIRFSSSEMTLNHCW